MQCIILYAFLLHTVHLVVRIIDFQIKDNGFKLSLQRVVKYDNKITFCQIRHILKCLKPITTDGNPILINLCVQIYFRFSF